MATTAWRFSGTEGADDAVLRLQRLGGQELIDVRDVAVIRWPQYAAGPQVQEHVTDEGSKASSFAKKLSKAGIDSSMIESVKADMTPGTSALVLLSTDAVIDTVAKAFEGHAMELMRSDLSVQQEDRLRAALGDPAGAHRVSRRAMTRRASADLLRMFLACRRVAAAAPCRAPG